MTRIRLFHWNAAEGAACANELRALGYEVELKSAVDPADVRVLGQSPPDAVVIDLRRLPSHGREVGAALRKFAMEHGKRLPQVCEKYKVKTAADLPRLTPDQRADLLAGIPSR